MDTQFTILPEHADMRLDHFLVANMPGYSRSRIQDAVKKGLIKVNGKVPSAHYFLHEGEVVVVSSFAADNKPVLAPKSGINLPILFEDDSIIVVNKPSGLIVHPAVASDTESVASAILAHFPAIAGVGDDALRPGIVHRLDKEASGVMVVAKTQKAFEELKDQFQDHTIGKEYTVMVEGAPNRDEGTITFAIGRKSNSGRMSARPTETESDRAAITHFEVLERFHHTTLLKVRTETGRTHQVRVHMKAFGLPVVGDPLYGNPKSLVKGAPRLFLHASLLAIDHPVTGERMTFEAPLAADLATFVEKLRS